MQETGQPRFLGRGFRFSFTLAVIATLVLMLGVFSGRLAAQVQTSTVTGTVTDPSGAVIVGATVELTQSLTGSTRSTKSDASGNFTFANVVPGTYSLRITQTGFQTYNHTGMVLAAAETLSLHKIALAVGATSTQVTVTAEAARVETQSSSQAGLVSESQITNIPNKGRNYMDYLTLLPGTVGSAGGTDAPGWGSGRVQFNGGDAGTVLVLLNGIASQDTGAPGAPAYISPSTDSVAEERVHTGVEDAQYGGRAGGTVDVVTKNGTSQFHGDLYWFNRNNFYNANDYFRKLNGISQPAPYKFNDLGGTIGGPILIPGTGFNASRQRAFFFFSLDTLHRTISGNTTNVTMPTPAERAGVFAGLTQALVNPYNPAAAPVCSGTSPHISCTFPAAAKDTAGDIILNALPEPTCVRAGDLTDGLAGAAGTYNSTLFASLPTCSDNNHNYNYTNSFPYPWHNDVLRTDFKLSNNELFYVVAGTNREERQGFTGFLGGNGNWPQSLTNYLIRSRQLMGSLVSTLSSTVVNEITLGTNYALQSDYANTPSQLTNNNRASLGLTPTVLPVLFPDPNNGGYQYPSVNEHNLIPNISFGGVTNLNSDVGGSSTSLGATMPNAPAFSFESRYPFFGTDWDWTFTDNLSWVKGNHNMKFGIFYEHVSRSTATYSNQGGSQFNGVLTFTSTGIYSPSNAAGSPFDTGNTFANAYVGAFANYSEDNTRWISHGVNHDLAWYAQDNWRVTSRLTLDLGMRFTIMVPDYLRNGQLVSEFQPFLYDATAQPRLILPCINGAGLRVGQEGGTVGVTTCTGTEVAPSTIGLYDPTTYSGKVPPYSGMMQNDGLVYRTPKIGLGPRFGFAWDIFGNGKTAVRGGFGIFFDRTGGIDDTLTKADQPPLILSPFLFNSTLQQVLSAGSGQTFLGPQNVAGPQRLYSQPQTYDAHMDIQQDLTHGILLDVGYVGILSRHFQRHYEYNDLSYGEHFQAAYTDPTTGTNYIDNITRCLDSNLYCGYSSVNYSAFDSNSNYNAMEVTVNKRFGANVIGGASYTWSKVLDYNGCARNGCPTHSIGYFPGSTAYLPGGMNYYYGPGGNDRRQNLTLNWHYNLPSPFQSAIAKETLNGWSLEGIASFISGAPRSISASYHGDPTGSGDSGTVPIGADVSGSIVNLQKSAKGVYYLNSSAFTAATNGPTNCVLNDPTTCGLGNTSPRDVFTGPGTNNWNISLLKKFPLGRNESRYLQFRWETYNTFNHPQFSNPGTRLSFNSPGGGGNNSGSFGQITSLAVPSRIQVLALKLYF